ncbi:MAG: CDP-alcohol phosphatidyltransferase family protein [Deltaproteobacteria bacterium]|nr:CDP-alcohol phosphatidyltransferase family protein [Deltaproteobacteria bacterium]
MIATSIVLLLRAVPHEAEGVAFDPLLGVPLFLRNLLTLAHAGFTRFALVAPAHARRHILKAWQRRNLHLDLIACRPEHRMTAETLQQLQRLVANRFCLIDTNTIITDGWIRNELRPALTHGRLLTAAGRIITARELDMWQQTMPADGIRVDQLLPTTRDRITEQTYPLLMRSDRHGAEVFLTEQIRLATRAFIARTINKRCSLPLSRLLARWRIHPHGITAFNMLVGLAAGIGTAGVTYTGLLIGACLFQLASILDGCDGEVAKLTFRTSKFGQYIDTVSDNFCLVSFCTGLVIHHYRVVDPYGALLLGVLLLGGLGVLLATMIRFLKTETDSFSLVTFEREYVDRLAASRRTAVGTFAHWGKTLVKKDCFSLIALLMAIPGWLPIWFYLAIVGAWAGVLTIYLLQRQSRWAPAATMATQPAIIGRKNAHVS